MSIKNKFAVAFSAVVMSLMLVVPAMAATTIITPGNLAISATGWYFYNDTTNTASTVESPPNYDFVTGVSSTGNGSLRFEQTNIPSERWNIATAQFAGMDLDEVTNMSFDMKTPEESTGGTATTLFLNIDVDFDSTTTNGYQGRLIYLPQNNGTPVLNSWQTWDAFNDSSVWGWSRYASNGNKWPDNVVSANRTLSDILSEFPNITVWGEGPGQLLIRSGHPGPEGMINYVDNIVVNETAFNLEDNFTRSAEITSPAISSKQLGMVSFEAYLTDDDIDAIQWAVRKGTCAMGTNTVFGNVDGHHDVATINTSNPLMQTFEFVGDMSSMEAGMYCFIYNPVEDSGETNIRLTQEFQIASKDDCKKGGWATFNNPEFKNQGDCVSFIASNGKAGGNPILGFLRNLFN